MTIEQLESEMRQCRKCEGIFKPRFIDPLTERQRLQVRPIFAGTINSPVMLVGQAPGISEYEKGKAFQGQAGQDIRRIFATAGVPLSDFDTLVYQTSITKCFPGRKKVSRKQGFTEEDRQPSVGEISNCIPYLKRQIELIQPQLSSYWERPRLMGIFASVENDLTETSLTTLAAPTSGMESLLSSFLILQARRAG